VNKEEVLLAIKEIRCRYSLPYFEINYTDKDYAINQFEKLVIHLANQQEEKDKEIERLNDLLQQKENIIKEVREYNEKIIEEGWYGGFEKDNAKHNLEILEKEEVN
jgi:hypothetical protein